MIKRKKDNRNISKDDIFIENHTDANEFRCIINKDWDLIEKLYIQVNLFREKNIEILSDKKLKQFFSKPAIAQKLTQTRIPNYMSVLLLIKKLRNVPFVQDIDISDQYDLYFKVSDACDFDDMIDIESDIRIIIANHFKQYPCGRSFSQKKAKHAGPQGPADEPIIFR